MVTDGNLPNEDRAISIDHLAWPEVERRIADGYKTVVFGVGATEQHGPHLPMCVDELLGTAFAFGVAKRLGSALVAPTIRPGVSPQHMGFHGTITLRYETLGYIVEDYIHSLLQHGLDRFVSISTHLTNKPVVELICSKLQYELRGRAIIVPIYSLGQYVPQADTRFEGLLEGFHANNFETSLMLYLAPSLVSMPEAEPGGQYPRATDPFIARMQHPVEGFSGSGVLGHPERASRELGEQAFAAIVDNVAREVEAVSAFLRAAPEGHR